MHNSYAYNNKIENNNNLVMHFNPKNSSTEANKIHRKSRFGLTFCNNNQFHF